MRKIKNKKEKCNNSNFDFLQEQQKALLEAERIFEKPEEYKVFQFLVKECDKLSDVVMTDVAKILADITTSMYVKDKNKRIKAETAIRINALKFINSLAPALLPNANTHAFMTLLELNEILTDYTGCQNRFAIEVEKVALKKDYDVAKELLKEKESYLVKPIKEILNYEPVFLGDLKEKCQETLNWIAKTMIRMMKYNSEIIIHETLFNSLDIKLDATYKDIERKFSFTEESQQLFFEENLLLKEQTARLKFIKNNIKDMELENKHIFPLEYKKDITHLKNTLTRIKNLFTIFYNLSNYGEVTGSSNLDFVEDKA